MTTIEKEMKLAELRAREQRILAKGKHFNSPGALKKIRRKISMLEKSLTLGEYFNGKPIGKEVL